MEAPLDGRPVAVGRSLESNGPAELVMENILEKLKLLNYERNFLRLKKTIRPPLTRTYFAFPMSSGAEQFFYFTGLVSWLFTVIGRTSFKAPSPSDDPNTVCTDILTELKACGFALPSWPAAKLKSGYGEPVCGVLDSLLDYVLESRNFRFQPAMIPKEEAADVEEVEDTPQDEEEEEEGQHMAYAGSDSDSDAGDFAVAPVAAPAAPAPLATQAAPLSVTQDLNAPTILESKVDPEEWRLELERVAPGLKIPVAADARDWRSHLDQVKGTLDEVVKRLPASKGHLEALRGQAESMEEKLSGRERSLNQQFEVMVGQYRELRRQLEIAQTTYNAKTDEVSRLQNDLGSVREQLEEVKSRLDEHGNSISDASPLMKITNAIKQLEGEVKQMEIRIGIVQNTLLQMQIQRDKSMRGDGRGGR